MSRELFQRRNETLASKLAPTEGWGFRATGAAGAAGARYKQRIPPVGASLSRELFQRRNEKLASKLAPTEGWGQGCLGRRPSIT